MEKSITGYTEIDSAKFAFFLTDFLLTLVLIDGDFPPQMVFSRYYISKLEGITSSFRKIYFFSLLLSTSCSTNELSTNITSYLLAESRDPDRDIDAFSAIAFTGDVVDHYFSPARKLDMRNSLDSFGKAIYMKSKEEVDYNIEIDHSLSFCFSVNAPSLPGQYSGEIGNLQTVFSLKSSSSWSIDDLQSVYLSVYRLFAFVNFRRNISFSEITLNRSFDGDKLEPIAKYFVAVGLATVNCTEKIR